MKLLIILTIVATLVASLLLQPNYETPNSQLILILPTAVLGLWAIWFFLRSLKNFKPVLRRPYVFLSIGITLLPLPHIIESFGLLADASASSVSLLALITYVFSTLFMYSGIRRLARILSVKSIWASPLFTLPLAIGIGVPAGMAAHGFSLGTPLISSTLLIISATFALGGAIAVTRVKENLGPSYARPMYWLAIALYLVVFTNIHELLMTWNLPESFTWYRNYETWPYILSGLAFLMAGQLFWKSGRLLQQDDAKTTYLDAVLYVAQLASDPRAFDVALDRVRLITAKLPNSQELSDSDKQGLIETYYEIEDYLVHKEPLRHIDRADLRSHLSYDFQQILRSAKK